MRTIERVPLTVETIEDREGFRQLRDEWSELLQASDADSLFLTWEWLYTWWTHLAGGRRLRLVTVRCGGRLAAVAPLAMRLGFFGVLLFPVLEFLGLGSVGSDYLDVILRRGLEADALAALAAHLGTGKHVLKLAQFRRDVRSGARGLAQGLGDLGWTAREIPFGRCPFISLAGSSWTSYLAGLGREHRRNFRRRVRQLATHFAVTIELVRTEEQRRAAFGALLSLHERRWRPRGGSKAFHTPALRAFHDELSRLALERGWLRLFLLRLDGQPAAALYGFMYGGRFYFYQQGFDPRYARYSAGLVLTGLTIEMAIAEGAAEYDFLSGEEGFKFLWAGQARDLSVIDLAPPGLRGLLYQRTLGLSRAARRLVLGSANGAAPSR